MPGISLITITAGPVPIRIDVAPLAVGLEGLLGEVLERGLPPARFAGRHGGTVASPVVAGPDRSLDPRLPVLVGLGAANEPRPVVELMTEAVRAAAADAGAPGLLGDRSTASSCPQGSWSLTDPARTVARRDRRRPARAPSCAEIGVSQQEVINHALAAVAAGRVRRRRRGRRRGAGLGARRRRRDGRGRREPPDEVLHAAARLRGPDRDRGRHGAGPSVQQYALIENALAAAEQLDARSASASEIAALWARFNEVAAHNPDGGVPGAPRRGRASPRPGPRNRPLAYPYNRWHASQWTVDQSSALLICSAERAREAGVPPERWLFPHVALHCSEAVTLTARRRLQRLAGHGGARPGRRSATSAGRCASSAWPRSTPASPPRCGCSSASSGSTLPGTPTLTGGMAFAGGPFNHFVLQSLVRAGPPAARRAGRARPRHDGVGHALQARAGRLVGHAARRRAAAAPGRPGGRGRARPPRSCRSSTTAAARATPATVVSFTVTYGGDDGLEPVRTAIVADLPDGVRTAATCEDAETARLAVAEGLIGRAVAVKDTTFSL